MELVELNSLNQHQERAVDVPESFIAVVKQAPRYPPPVTLTRLDRVDNKMNLSNEKLRLNLNYNNQNININNNKVGYEPEKLLKYSEEFERKKKSQEEFLRSSLRSSVKLNGPRNSLGRNSNYLNNSDFNKNAVINNAFEDEDYFDINNLPNLNLVLNRLTSNLKDNEFNNLVEKSNLVDLLNIYQDIVENQKQNKIDPMTNLSTNNAVNLLFEVICVLRLQDDPSVNQEVLELFNILTDVNFKNLFSIFEDVCKVKRDLNTFINTDNLVVNLHDNQNDVKIVNLKKSNCEPLGITIKNDLDGSVVIGRIVKGGTADKSGLLNEGDEIIEINGIELRGRNVNQICDMMSDINGVLTFIVAPKDPLRVNIQKNSFVHLRALFDYDPEDDIYIPCKELGICFNKGDILHIIDQTDPNWHQAFKEGEHDVNLAGLIPSAFFQVQREQMKKSLINNTDPNKFKNKKSYLCGMKKRKKNNLANDNSEEILTYEEIHLYYPKANIKRPIVLIGPTNVGRHELRQRIMLDTERFAAAVPHTSRNRRDGEMDGVDYHFITRNEFELYIRQGKFVEHGQYENNYYGTSLGAIEAVVQSGKICLLNLHVQSIYILRQSPAGAKLKPFFVFVTPPTQLDKLNKLISITTNNTFDNNHISNKDLQSIIEEAKEIESKFGHYFDMTLVMTDIDRAYQELLKEINHLECEAQWIPKNAINSLRISKKTMDDNLRNQMEKETDTNEPDSTTTELPHSTIATRPANSTKWLVANQQKLPNLNTFSSCICLADLNGDNDYRLVIGDYGDSNNIRLLIFKGINIQAQIKLNDYPVAVTSFYMDQNDVNVPSSISVAAGSSIFIYKNLKPFYKFTLPLCQVNSTEEETWNLIYDKLIDTNSFRAKLFELRKQFGESALTAKSQAFLDLDEKNLDKLNKFIEDYKDEPLKKFNLITCMNTIKKSTADEKAICYLIIGTENCDLFIIEPSAFTVISSFKLPSVAVFIEVSGSFDDSEYRIMISCRDAHIYTIKRNLTKPRLSVQLVSQCCSMVKMNSNIVIACIDNSLNCFSGKGQSLWTIKQPAAITAMTSINIEMFGIRMIAVALANKEIIFYNEKNVYDVLLFDEVIYSLKFGRFNREDALILISETGQLTIMILKRTAKFYNLEPENKNILNDLASNTTKLNIPKKTKYFVDQTMRERDNSIIIHRTFQQDLYRLKLITSRAYVKAINHSLNPISSNNSHPIKLSVSIHGLGPIFKLNLELQNISVDQPSVNLFMTFKCNPKIYQITPNFLFIPFISPGNNYTFNNKVELINDLGLSESIRIYVCKRNEKVPIITAICNMPKCEVI